jgi:hypothetical protein
MEMPRLLCFIFKDKLICIFHVEEIEQMHATNNKNLQAIAKKGKIRSIVNIYLMMYSTLYGTTDPIYCINHNLRASKLLLI